MEQITVQENKGNIKFEAKRQWMEAEQTDLLYAGGQEKSQA